MRRAATLIVLVCIVAGIFILVSGAENSVLIGLAFIILGPIAVRIYSEILIVFFRINDHLRHIDHHTEHA